MPRRTGLGGRGRRHTDARQWRDSAVTSGRQATRIDRLSYLTAFSKPHQRPFVARLRDPRVVRYGFMQEERGAPRGRRNASIQASAICLCALYAAVTFTVMARATLRGSSFEQLEPYQTTDSFLRVLDAPHPGLLVENSLRRYAPDQRLLFVGPAGEPSTLRVYYTISHLAYPRPVAAIFCGEPGKSRTSAVERVPRTTQIGGLIFFETDPGPWAAGGTRVTSRLSISPYKGADPWESFCR